LISVLPTRWPCSYPDAAWAEQSASRHRAPDAHRTRAGGKVLDLVDGVSGLVLDVVDLLLGLAANAVGFAFVLEILVVGHVADSLFGAALDLVGLLAHGDGLLSGGC
jgi:hypothetical protein